MNITNDSSRDWIVLKRTVRFGDTDAAGVMHFHKLLAWCHEAYEESLEHFGIKSIQVFPQSINPKDGITRCPYILLPIVHCSADYRVPLICGDNLTIEIVPRIVNLESFEVYYTFTCEGVNIAQGKTRHLAIQSTDHQRCLLPAFINDWINTFN
uniref:1,4-dihydroxy-2-naphthoyl-CoA hydrolase n=1 Tax=Paulinella longichromatophora TaxID=1708747 RepID=A0A2H4ZP68_9EUKA|nr:hypothetical protein PLO_329 [Paulinella longichromatophora]